MKRIILLSLFFTTLVLGQNKYTISDMIEDYVKGNSTRYLKIDVNSAPVAFTSQKLDNINQILSSIGLKDKLDLSSDEFLKLVDKGSGQRFFGFNKNKTYRFYFVNREPGVALKERADIQHILWIRDTDQNGQNFNFWQIYNLKNSSVDEYKLLEAFVFACLYGEQIVGPQDPALTATTPKNVEESKFLVEKRINDPFIYQRSEDTNKPAFTVDFTYLSRLTLYWTFLSENFLGGDENNHFLIAADVNRNEKVLPLLPGQNDNIKWGLRFVIPGTSYLNDWGMDFRLYAKTNNVLAGSEAGLYKSVKKGNLNSNSGGVLDLYFFNSPLYFNLYASVSSNKYTDPQQVNKGIINDYSYFSFFDFQFTHSFFWDFNEFHKLKFDFGVGGYDVFAAEYNNNVFIGSRKVSNITVLPVVEVTYNMLTEPRPNYLLGANIRFFDSKFKVGAWLQLFSYQLGQSKLVGRLESMFLTDKVLGVKKEYEEYSNSGLLVQFRLRYGF
ncbi:MAG TPA: hypothetical protein PLT92_11655 [Ignavibacteriaceae bacterium]|nr:hypothetical protein [Ignavibacteriaceae bacterium]